MLCIGYYSSESEARNHVIEVFNVLVTFYSGGVERI